MKLSVLVPSIRPDNLLALYHSVEDSFSGEFEFIVISPYPLPVSLFIRDNVKLIKSWRSPIACQQQGLLEAKGDYVAWAADDGVYLKGMLDESFSLLPKDDNTIIVSKYQEGNEPLSLKGMEQDNYYNLSYHDSMKMASVPKEAYVLNCGLVPRKLLMDMGGWDAENFQACPLSYNDFSIRALKYGAKFILQDKPVYKCSHMPYESGDHAPIHRAQSFIDTPIFNAMYREPNDRCRIPLNNWEKSEGVWSMRFKQEDIK